jgi:hypothetical protein
LRLEINCLPEIKLTPSVIWKFLKDVIGKDLSSVTIPVYFSEPFNILQKAGELGYYFTRGIEKAIQEEDQTKRLMMMGAAVASAFSVAPGRI